MQKTPQSGQSLIELVIGVAIGVLFITGALGIITVTLRLDLQNKFGQSASELAQELTEQVASVANADWHNLDLVTHGAETQYRLIAAGNFLALEQNTDPITINEQPFTRYFTIEDVKRDDLGRIITDGTGTADPSTLKIIATVQWTDKGDPAETVFTRYLTRDRDRVAAQEDWVQGVAASPETTTVTDYDFGTKFASSSNIRYSVPGEITINNLATSTPVGPYSNIDSTPFNYYAWNDVIGWIDFHMSNTIHVTSTEITGFANSINAGYIAMNCNSVPPNATTNVCPSNGGPSQFGVLNNANNEGAGKLSGEAWSDNLGWISFKDRVSPLMPAYQVSIDQTTGEFHGFAWNDVIGWISFNCADDMDPVAPGVQSVCGIVDYKVKVNSGVPAEGTLTSRIYDTERSGGAAPNTIVWQGSQPLGTRVRFLIASSNCANGATNAPTCNQNIGWGGSKVTGDGAFIGPTGDSAIYYEADQNVSVPISRALHNNKSYLRYRVFLHSDPDRLVTPTVNSISLNWSL